MANAEEQAVYNEIFDMLEAAPNSSASSLVSTPNEQELLDLQNLPEDEQKQEM